MMMGDLKQYWNEQEFLCWIFSSCLQWMRVRVRGEELRSLESDRITALLIVEIIIHYEKSNLILLTLGNVNFPIDK